MNRVVESVSSERPREVLREETVNFQPVKTRREPRNPRFRQKELTASDYPEW